jgi:hypothetical protein
MNRFTTQQVNEQKQRFENFLKTVNLVRIGQKFVTLALINATGIHYPEFTYLRRVLNTAKVNSEMIYPDNVNTNTYRDILHERAIKAYFQSTTTV